MTDALRIAIDASRATVARTTGTEYYARELIRHIIAANAERATPHQLTLYCRDTPPAATFPDDAQTTVRVVRFPRLWTHLRFARELWRTRPNVTFVPAHTLPFGFPGRAVVTVHDLGYKYFPQAHPALQRTYLDWTTRYSARRATRILADSQATADDLTRFYDTPAAKIRVVYPGVARPQDNHAVNIYEKYHLPLRYFLFIGTLQPRKNIERIVQAFAMWRRANPKARHGLVLAGQQGWLFDPAWVRDVENVYPIGYIDEADKGALLRQAIALIFPTLHEGFGFPVVEAMLCGTPVIASTTSSLPELVGDAGMLVNPLEVNEIAAAMDLITINDFLHRKLMIKGFDQARQFKWQTAARTALTVLEEAARA